MYRDRRRLAPSTMLTTAALLATMTVPASAGVVLNTIDRDVSLDHAGRLVAVTGPIRCSQAERATIRVTVSQRSTGAVAEGRWRGLCQRATTTWTAKRFALHIPSTFQPGTAQACALAITRRASKVTDAKQWCETVALHIPVGQKSR